MKRFMKDSPGEQCFLNFATQNLQGIHMNGIEVKSETPVFAMSMMGNNSLVDHQRCHLRSIAFLLIAIFRDFWSTQAPFFFDTHQ